MYLNHTWLILVTLLKHVTHLSLKNRVPAAALSLLRYPDGVPFESRPVHWSPRVKFWWYSSVTPDLSQQGDDRFLPNTSQFISHLLWSHVNYLQHRTNKPQKVKKPNRKFLFKFPIYGFLTVLAAKVPATLTVRIQWKHRYWFQNLYEANKTLIVISSHFFE
jgi:hypothetical protein